METEIQDNPDLDPTDAERLKLVVRALALKSEQVGY